MRTMLPGFKQKTLLGPARATCGKECHKNVQMPKV
jgi:hypothetical protein